MQGYGVITKKGAAGKFVSEYSSGRLLLILISAYWAAIKGLPEMWRKRKDIKRLTKVTNKEFSMWLRQYGIGVKELSLKD